MNMQRVMQVVQPVSSVRDVNIHVTCARTVPSVTLSRLHANVLPDGLGRHAGIRVHRLINHICSLFR